MTRIIHEPTTPRHTAFEHTNEVHSGGLFQGQSQELGAITKTRLGPDGVELFLTGSGRLTRPVLHLSWSDVACIRRQEEPPVERASGYHVTWSVAPVEHEDDPPALWATVQHDDEDVWMGVTVEVTTVDAAQWQRHAEECNHWMRRRPPAEEPQVASPPPPPPAGAHPAFPVPPLDQALGEFFQGYLVMEGKVDDQERVKVFAASLRALYGAELLVQLEDFTFPDNVDPGFAQFCERVVDAVLEDFQVARTGQALADQALVEHLEKEQDG